MRKAIAAAGLAAMTVSTSGCARDHGPSTPGPTVERNYNVGAFDKVELAGAYDATVRTGSAVSVHAKGGQNVLDQLVVEVKDGKLLIHSKKRMGFHWGWGHNNGKVELAITVPALSAATLAGSGGINIDKVQGDSFEGTVAGSGGLSVGSVNVGSLKLSIAGSGDAKAGGGKAQTAKYDIAGSGGVDAGGVQTADLKVSIAGSGDVKAHSSGNADVSIMGSGDVEVAGGAKCNVHKAGSGSVRCS
jgi:hypothetical protein